MIIKLKNVISCSSEHPSYPASNLLQYRSNASWRCGKPGEMLATVIFQLAEPSNITGLDIGNYRSCVVIITASTSTEPDNWVPIVNHQFLTNDEAANGKFKDQVQLFTKKDLNPDTLKIKFDRVKVTCMQSANLKELFGLLFIILRTEVVVDLGLDVFGRFKLKKTDGSNDKPPVDEFKEKYLKMVNNKKTDYKNELLTKIKETGMNKFSKRQDEEKEPMKRPLLEKLESGREDEVFGNKAKPSNNASMSNDSKNNEKTINNNASASTDKPVARTPFGDIVPSKTLTMDKTVKKNANQRHSTNSKKRSLSPEAKSPNKNVNQKKHKCHQCQDGLDDKLCNVCGLLPKPKPTLDNNVKTKNSQLKKPKRPFAKLCEDVSFALSGYVNPQRDNIRKKALQMGAKYIANPNTTNNKCTHLICAFKKTPKSQQLQGHCKIVSHDFIEECFDQKKRLPWRRYALNTKEKNEPESEEEIEAGPSFVRPNPFDADTDSDSY
ncbi:hypothetical protein KM043_007785 [Ampulex compressa]|nr:hypothetical protein KM043_007785 [Ampulex compressa]